MITSNSALNDQVFVSGAAIGLKRLTFTRHADDTTHWTGAAIRVNLFPRSGETIVLSVGAGVTKITDTASSQVANIEISESQVTALLNGRSEQQVRYEIEIQPTGGEAIKGNADSDYSGQFTVIKEGW